MKKPSFILSFLLAASFLFYSCDKSEVIEIKPDAIHGMWSLDSMVTVKFIAYNNTKTSNTVINSAYYIKFDPYGQAEVNLSGQKKKQTYTKEGTVLLLGETQYDILSLTKSKLKMRNTIWQEANYQEQTLYFSKKVE